MSKYPRTTLPNVISVRSIITVWHFCLQHQTSAEDIHDHPEILYVDEGVHFLSVGGKEMKLTAGQLVIYGPDTPHSGPVPSDAHIDIISFEAEAAVLAPFYNRVITLSSRQKAMLSQLVTKGTDLFDRLRHKYGFVDLPLSADIQDYELQRLKNELELFLLDIYGNERSEPIAAGTTNYENSKAAQFDAFRQFLKAHINTQLSLAQMSDALSISPSALNKLCREQCGCSPVACFIRLKIGLAKQMICETTKNFTQIAEELGYTSVHYFSKQFKKETGKTPSEFSRSVLKK